LAGTSATTEAALRSSTPGLSQKFS
jgi:hypothetical protein